jgi:aromatic ring-cleaving dioxygenase
MIILLSFVIAVGFLAGISGHPTRYVDLPSDLTCDDLPPVYSHHIHVLFWQNNNDSVNAAFALRAAFMTQFQLTDKDNTCDEHKVWNTTHPIPLCMFTPDFPNPEPPFLTSEWAAFVPLENFQETVLWIMQQRGSLDVLVHPNSGCEINDHRDWPLWGGMKWELDISIMHYNCPGCDDGSCVKIGSNLMMQGQAYSCGLANGTKPGRPFVLNDPKQFCSANCQQWVDQLEAMPSVCQRVCDNFPKEPQLDICKTHVASLPEMQQWQLQYCH